MFLFKVIPYPHSKIHNSSFTKPPWEKYSTHYLEPLSDIRIVIFDNSNITISELTFLQISKTKYHSLLLINLSWSLVKQKICTVSSLKNKILIYLLYQQYLFLTIKNKMFC